MRFIDRSKRRLLVLGAAGVLAAAFAVPALAQSASDETSAPSDEAAPSDRFADHRADFAEALAAELDLPVDQVTEALVTVHEQLHQQRMDERQAAIQQRLDEAVANGQLTQEQADAIAEAAEAGVLGRRGFRGDGQGRHRHGHRGWFGGPGAPGANDATPGGAAEDQA